MSQRTFDVIVYGATGYTGELVAKYLSKKKANFAIAGRNSAKLNALASQLSPSVPIIVAAADDSTALEAMCQQTVVVIACAGPFSLCGMPLVDACVKTQTHYVDITGEFHFVRKMIDRHHAQAEKQGTMLVPMSGFDVVPVDYCNYIVHRASKFVLDEGLKEVRVVAEMPKGKGQGWSLGTAKTIANMVGEMSFKELTNGHIITPPKAAEGVAVPMQMTMWYDKDAGITAPYFPGTGDERMVRRSNGLLGSRATYFEAMAPGGFFRALAVTAVYWTLNIIMVIPPLRHAFIKIMERQTLAPTEHYFGFNTYATSEKTGTLVTGKLSCSMGAYPVTAAVVSEVALCIVEDIVGKRQPTACGLRGGVLSSAALAGDLLFPRLRPLMTMTAEVKGEKVPAAFWIPSSTAVSQ